MVRFQHRVVLHGEEVIVPRGIVGEVVFVYALDCVNRRSFPSRFNIYDRKGRKLLPHSFEPHDEAWEFYLMPPSTLQHLFELLCR